MKTLFALTAIVAAPAGLAMAQTPQTTTGSEAPVPGRNDTVVNDAAANQTATNDADANATSDTSQKKPFGRSLTHRVGTRLGNDGS